METESKAMKLWLENLALKSASSRKLCPKYFDEILRRYDIPSAEAFYQMKLEDLKSPDPRDRNRVERMILNWIAELKANNTPFAQSVQMTRGARQPGTLMSTITAVRSFFRANGVELNFDPATLPKGESIGRNIIQKTQIDEVFDACPNESKKRNRALICFAKDTGLRISDIVALNVGDYRNAVKVVDKNETFLIFDPERTKKCGVNAFVHIGPEAVRMVDEYLAERGQVDDADPLFILADGRKGSGNRMTPSSGTMVLKRLCAYVQNGKRLGAHSFRKFHTTSLESAGMPSSWIKKLQGKSVGKTDGAYSHPEQLLEKGKEIDQLTAKYISCYNELRIFGIEVLPEQIEQMEKNFKLTIEKMQEGFKQEMENQREIMFAEFDQKALPQEIEPEPEDPWVNIQPITKEERLARLKASYEKAEKKLKLTQGDENKDLPQEEEV